MADFTTTRLLQRIRKRAGLATWDEGIDVELLERANDEQRLYLTTLLESAKEQYRQTTTDFTVDASLRVYLPTRAIAAGIKMLEGVDSSGKRWFLAELKDENFGRCRTGDFYVEGNQVVFYRAPLQSTLRVTYSRRLAELVQTSAANLITGILNATQFTIGSDVIGNPPWDLVRGKPHFDILAMDATGSELSHTVTIPAGLPTGLAKGDWLCAPDTAPLCQAPLELHPLLAQQTAYTYLAEKGDPNAQAAMQRRDREESDAKRIIQPRIEQGERIINPNAPGWGGWPRRVF